VRNATVIERKTDESLLIATTALTLLVAPMSGAFAKDWNDRMTIAAAR